MVAVETAVERVQSIVFVERSLESVRDPVKRKGERH